MDPEAFEVQDSIEYSDLAFSLYAKHGFANLITDPPAVYQEDVKQCRSFVPKYTMYDEDHYAFAVQMCMQFDSLKTKRFLARNKDEEFINYRGNVEFEDIRLKTVAKRETATTKFPKMFSAIDVEQLFNLEFDSSLFKDKIVILGFLGSSFGDPSWNDKYFTPLNKKVSGRANPDMFGVIVHANIVAMILNEDYVNALSDWQKYLIAMLLCFLTVALFITIDRRLPAWFDTLSVTIQVLQILAISGLTIYFFSFFSFKLDLAIAIGASALVGPAYDIYKGFQNQITIWQYKRKLTKTESDVLRE
jgi:CHASE2 domain-containing sensor protein